MIAQSQYRRAMWKNGLGHTDEIAIYPEGSELKSGNFLWRISTARIERNSPFSLFPHHDRTLVILRGEGVRLQHALEGNQESVEVPMGEPYDFPGDVASECELIDGPVQDLSVFVRKGEVESMVEFIRLDAEDSHEWVPAGRWNFAFLAQGTAEVHAPHAGMARLGEGDTLAVELAAPLAEDSSYVLTAGALPAQFVLISLQG